MAPGLVCAMAAVTGACSSAPPPASGRASALSGTDHRTATGTGAGLPPSTPPTTAATTTTTVPPTTDPAAAGWTVAGTVTAGPAVEERTITAPSGVPVVLLRFLAGRTTVDLHVGSGDPPADQGSLPPTAVDSVTAAERPSLLAAFNGGFRTDTGTGGFEVGGVVLRPLVAGDASLVVDSDGSARVEVWGQTGPGPGEAVSSVRQNLLPLVGGGQPSSSVNQIYGWGATLGGGSYVARSALGSDAAGNLVYAASRSAVPADLAGALIDAGCVTAMELDINPYWVQADVAATPGGPLTAVVPDQNRPATQFLTGWTRDFFTVQAAG